MGKGFNNYMCKKFFHPASRDNLKRVWMAEQKTAAYKQKQEELRVQYEKEQDLYNNKALLSKESKDKLSVNFMYEPPPGMKREREKESGDPEYKFEWQRKYNAPREDYCKGDEEIRDQPFGIQVRNVRCIRCHKWGHINTDRECSMRGQSNDVEGLEMDPLMLMHKMREEGLAIKHSALGVRQNAPGANQELVDEESGAEEEDPNLMISRSENPEQAFLEKLSTKQKKKLLRKLEKMAKEKKKKKKSKHSKSKKHKKSKASSSSSSSSSSESDDETSKNKKEKSKARKRTHSESESKPEVGIRSDRDRNYRENPDFQNGRRQLDPSDRRRDRSAERQRERDEKRRKRDEMEDDAYAKSSYRRRKEESSSHSSSRHTSSNQQSRSRS